MPLVSDGTTGKLFAFVCRHKHRLPYALVTQEFAKQLGQVQDATLLKQQGATGQYLRQAAQLLSEDVIENWPTVSAFPVFDPAICSLLGLLKCDLNTDLHAWMCIKHPLASFMDGSNIFWIDCYVWTNMIE